MLVIGRVGRSVLRGKLPQGCVWIMSQIKYLLLISRQGKLRLQKWYVPLTAKEKTRIIKNLTAIVLARRPQLCNFVTFGDHQVAYRRYASLYFVCGMTPEVDNELGVLGLIHRYVETLDAYFGNVCELDIIFNFTKAYDILDELVMCDGSLAETSKKEALQHVQAMDLLESNDHLDRVLS